MVGLSGIFSPIKALLGPKWVRSLPVARETGKKAERGALADVSG
jgi:hypothetical protein